MIINTLWGPEEIKGKICSNCGEEKLLNQFYHRFYDGKRLSQRKTTCKECEKRNVRISRKLYKENIIPNGLKNCQMCNKEKELILDHDHDTEKFRGWICAECNHGLGLLGDKLEGVMNAKRYLEKYDTF